MTTHKQLYQDYLRLVSFATRLLNPDDLGLSVSAEIRDAAREALGIEPCESFAAKLAARSQRQHMQEARQPSVTQPETDSKVTERNDK